MHFKLTVKFEMEWIMIMKFNIAIFVFTEKNQVITLGHHRGLSLKTEHNGIASCSFTANIVDIIW